MANQKKFYVLTAPVGQLCGNGQLRETISERRNRKGDNVPFWYLSPELVKRFDISDSILEAVVAEEKTAINWLQLRFGGDLSVLEFDHDLLIQDAMELPPSAKPKDISISD